MRKNFVKLLFIFLLLALVAGHALAIPYEYAISGTAAYQDSNGDWVFSGQSITGSFVLSDSVRYVASDTMVYEFSLRDMYIAGDSFTLSGEGFLSVLFMDYIMSGLHYTNESTLYLNLGDYIARDDCCNGWYEYIHFYNEDGSGDSSFHDHPYGISTYGSLYSTNGDIYALRINAIRGGAVPEPSTMILLGSGLIGLIGIRNKLKKK